MPYYTFSHPETNETKEIFFHMNDDKKYSENGVEWQRIWHKPQASVDTTFDPFSPADFAKKTGQKRGTVGDLMDKSAELSEQRTRILGTDPIREKFHQDYEKKTKKLHPDRIKKNNEKTYVVGD